MEKRLFLSFVLSFAILYVWFGVLSPPPTKTSNGSQTYDIKELKRDEISPAPPSPLIEIESHKSELMDFESELPQQTYVLESPKLRAEFSDLGGQLKRITIRDYDKQLPITDIFGLGGFEGKKFNERRISDSETHFVFDSEDYRIVRTYVLSKDGYDLRAETTIINKTQMSKEIDIKFGILRIDALSLDNTHTNVSKDAHEQSLHEYVIKTDKEVFRKNNAHKFASKEAREDKAKVAWAGFRDRYYCAIVRPEFDNKGYQTDVFTDKIYDIRLNSIPLKLAPAEEGVFAATIYVGPESAHILKKYEGGIAEIKRFYRLELFDAISKLIHWIMHGLYRPLRNWGLVIIVLSILIYYSTYPLTLKGMSSMKKMQALQPKMTALREKHKNNPEKLNKEIMEMYKEEKINPMGGCLPFLLQMPIFIGLYQVLWRDVSFKGAGFLWIKDLSEPDRLFLLPKPLPIIGNEINILPILMIFVMAYQQHLSAKSMVLTDPQQIAQQKMMARIMPIFIGFIFYKFASGLALYFTLFYVFSTLTQLKMNKQPVAA